MSQSTPSEPLEIAAHKVKKVARQNLMQPGAGTPWEDRGALGLGKAIWRTCRMSLSQPVHLMELIHRPETSGDSTTFALACAFLWSISWAIHWPLWLLRYQNDPNVEIDYQTFWLGMALQCLVLIPGTVLGFLRLVSRMFHRMVSHEMENKIPPVLTYNLFGYCLGPSILALIPFVGPPIAAVWIAVLLIVAGRRRLQLSLHGSIIAVALCLFVVGVISIVGYFALGFLWNQATNGGMITVSPPQSALFHPAHR